MLTENRQWRNRFVNKFAVCSHTNTTKLVKIKKKVHYCGDGFKGEMIKIRRDGKTLQFCGFCGRR